MVSILHNSLTTEHHIVSLERANYMLTASLLVEVHQTQGHLYVGQPRTVRVKCAKDGWRHMSSWLEPSLGKS
eukprot:4118233-Amphidinium_carterae.2